jgi:hypothetical protein
MKKTMIALILVSFCGLAAAQIKTDQVSPTVRIYEPKNRDYAIELARFVTSVAGGVNVTWEPAVQALVLRSPASPDSAANLDAAEALLKRFDQPRPKPASPQAELTAYLVLAANGTPPPRMANDQTPEPPNRPVPAELQSAIDEMKRTFAYDHYTLVDAIIVQPNGEGELSGILPWNPYMQETPTVYSVAYKYGGVTEAKSVYLNGFQLVIERQGVASKIKTDVVVHENQKLVLGKVRLNRSGNADLFIVLTARLR